MNGTTTSWVCHDERHVQMFHNMKWRTTRAAALTFLAAFVLAPFGTAQDVTTGEISGAVLLVLNNRDMPLKGVSVVLSSLGTGRRRRASTDSNGNFVFAELSKGYYDVRAEPVGYESQERRRVFVPLNL